MSHELRTPLISLLILAHQLAENPEGNLSTKQVQFARTIHGAGTDLMGLINDILDLSKIESGTVTIEIDEVLFADLREFVDRTFRHVAEDKRLAFEIEIAEDLPFLLATDSKRLRQVIKNLLSNAFKFTDQGRVALRIQRVESGWSPDHPFLGAATSVIAISVEDTGIGIPAEKQRLIFEAFQQADGSTARKYGGTGLGLSISREIARLLGGELTLHSRPRKGSTFTLYIPDEHPSLGARSRGPVRTADALRALIDPLPVVPGASMELVDDLANITPEDRVLLIIENEINFARILLDMARDAGLKAVVASRGEAAIALARRLAPVAITLDLRLPDMSGSQVLTALKNDPDLQTIPVHVISGVTDGHDRILDLGAASYWLKPVDSQAIRQLMSQFLVRGSRRLLVLGSPYPDDQALREAAGRSGATVVGCDGPEDAIVEAETGGAEVVVLPLDPPGMPATEFVRKLASMPHAAETTVIVCADGAFPKRREAAIRKAAGPVRVRCVDGPEGLRSGIEALARSAVLVPPAGRGLRRKPAAADLETLGGKRVLVVDDDVRNIFALTSLLERYGIEVLYADNGRAAISMLRTTPEIDIVLMDIMMPGMDGFQATREIRTLERFRHLPIIALTARAMKGDREKCIEAGASDYVPKPVAPDHLLSVLCEWAKQRPTATTEPEPTSV